MKRQNDIVRNLWAQIFESDEEGEVAQRELTTHALRETGWSEAEIEYRNQSARLHGDVENPNSPSVGPGIECRLNAADPAESPANSDECRQALLSRGEFCYLHCRMTTRNAREDRGLVVPLNRRDGSIPL